jgi:hypothetical protein
MLFLLAFFIEYHKGLGYIKGKESFYEWMIFLLLASGAAVCYNQSKSEQRIRKGDRYGLFDQDPLRHRAGYYLQSPRCGGL